MHVFLFSEQHEAMFGGRLTLKTMEWTRTGPMGNGQWAMTCMSYESSKEIIFTSLIIVVVLEFPRPIISRPTWPCVKLQSGKFDGVVRT